MVTLQGANKAKISMLKLLQWRQAQKATVIEDLVAYIYDESRGMSINVPQNHAIEKALLHAAKMLFTSKAVRLTSAAPVCHSEDGKRIRLQDLPNLTKPSKACTSSFQPMACISCESRWLCAPCSGVCTIALGSSVFLSCSI